LKPVLCSIVGKNFLLRPDLSRINSPGCNSFCRCRPIRHEYYNTNDALSWLELTKAQRYLTFFDLIILQLLASNWRKRNSK
jgi:hypothetical protein